MQNWMESSPYDMFFLTEAKEQIPTPYAIRATTRNYGVAKRKEKDMHRWGGGKEIGDCNKRKILVCVGQYSTVCLYGKY